MAKRRYTSRRRRNPFGAGGMNIVAVKVAGGLVGGIAAATVPNMLGASFGSGWGGVAAALVVAFGGAWLSRSSSANFSEGVLIGGTLQAAGRISQIVLKKNLVSFSLSGYGPMQFPVPTPAYQIPGFTGGGPATPVVQSSAAVSGSTKTMGRYRGMTKFAS